MDISQSAMTNGLLFPEKLTFSVTEFITNARALLERHLGDIWVTGEISGLIRATSGHYYFTLKDDNAQARCVLWKHQAALLRLASNTLRDGLRVDVRATATVFSARGELQLNITAIKLSGQGALYEKFLRQKARFEAEGLFAPERKRALPTFPRVIGVITSSSGAAVRDVVVTLKRRNPAINIVIYPTLVQGETAAASIARAIELANARRKKDRLDVLIVARGGGSFEDLWAFNEEMVVRAVFQSFLPVIAGVGHETDTTLMDFVADYRAATPTAAAIAASPDLSSLRSEADRSAGRFHRAFHRVFARAEERYDDAQRRLQSPQAMIDRETIALLDKRRLLSRAFLAQLRGCNATVARALFVWQNVGLCFSRESIRAQSLEDRLNLLNPEAIFSRGYAMVAKESGEVVTCASALALDETVSLTLFSGRVTARVIDRLIPDNF